MDIENVSLTEIIAAARFRHASLVPESAGYLLLGVMRAVGGRPIRIVASQVMLSTEGVVTLIGPREPLRASEAAAGMVALLGELLDVTQGKATALRAVAEDPEPKLDRVFTGVTKALIPINRAAAKRALARLAREAVRAKERGQLRPEDLHAPRPEVTEAAPEAPKTDWDALETDIEIVTPTPPPPKPRIAVAAAQLGGLPTHLDDAPVAPPPAPEDETLENTEVDAPVIANEAKVDRTDAPLAEPVTRAAVESPVEPVENVVEPVESEAASVEIVAAPVESEAASVEIMAAPVENVAAPHEIEVVRAESEACDPASPAVEMAEEADPIASETALAEKLARGAAQVARSGDRGDVERLLEDFGGGDGSDAVDEAVRSLQGLVGAAATPVPGIVAGARRRGALSIDHVLGSRRRAPARIARPRPDETARGAGSVVPTREAAAEAEPEANGEMGTPTPPSRPRARTLAGMASVASERVESEAPPPSRPVSMPRRGATSSRGVDLPFSPVASTVAPPAEPARALHVPTPAPGTPSERLSVELCATLAPAMAGVEDPVLDEPEEAVPSLSPPLVAVDERPSDAPKPDEVSSVPPASMPARPRGRPLGLYAFALLVTAAVAATIVGIRRPELVSRVQELAMPTPAASVQGTCLAELRLKDLPTPHEVLLRLGEAPLTAPLPTGVRLEIVAMAPERLPERIVIGDDAAWTEGPDGPSLQVEVALERQEGAHWPAAPAGDVGGVGPRGQVRFASTGGPAEMWLVAGAGPGGERTIEIPCDGDATLLAVNPEAPGEQRRLHIARRLLETAAEAGGADISLRP